MTTDINNSPLENSPVKNSPVKNSPVKNSRGIDVFQSRWGWHPCSREDYLRYKELHRVAYHEMRISRVHAAWERKTVHRATVEPPRSEFQTRMRLNHREMLIFYQNLLAEYRLVRMPVPDIEDVLPVVPVNDPSPEGRGLSNQASS